MKALPPIERLNELFSYDSLTGIVTNNTNRSPTSRLGDIVGTNNDGHLRVFIDGTHYQLHRIIWLMYTGSDPSPYEIDHINRIRDDNRIDNLRLVTTQDNLKNKSLYSTNKSGYSGVFKRGNRYMANYRLNGVRYHVGSYGTPEEAYDAICLHKESPH